MIDFIWSFLGVWYDMVAMISWSLGIRGYDTLVSWGLSSMVS